MRKHGYLHDETDEIQKALEEGAPASRSIKSTLEADLEEDDDPGDRVPLREANQDDFGRVVHQVPFLYFAYGANLDPGAMRHRCPTAIPIEAARVYGFNLRFCNVATIIRTKDIPASVNGRPVGTYVPGCLWHLNPADERSLDRFEGFPRLYRKEWVQVHTARRRVMAMVYIMNQTESSRPSQSYYDGIARGYRY